MATRHTYQGILDAAEQGRSIRIPSDLNEATAGLPEIKVITEGMTLREGCEVGIACSPAKERGNWTVSLMLDDPKNEFIFIPFNETLDKEDLKRLRLDIAVADIFEDLSLEMTKAMEYILFHGTRDVTLSCKDGVISAEAIILGLDFKISSIKRENAEAYFYNMQSD